MGYGNDEVFNTTNVGNNLSSKNIKAFFKFNSAEIFAKVAISPVSIEGAVKNLNAEINRLGF